MKRGFTLIELLAVIVILAIIALIAAPIVLNIINNSKESASIRSAELYVKAVEMSIANKIMETGSIDNDQYPIMSNGSICLKNYFYDSKTKEETCNGDDINDKDNVSVLRVEVSGEYPKEGYVVIEKSQVVKELSDGSGKKTQIVISGQTIVKNENNEFVLEETDENTPTGLCTLQDGYTANQVGSKYECEVKPGTKYNFYILSQESNGTTNLIMDRNICNDGSLTEEGKTCLVAWQTSGYNADSPVTAMDYLYNATKEWTNISNIEMNYTDEGNTGSYGYGTIVTTNNITKMTKKDGTAVTVLTNQEGYSNLKARLPYYSEVANSNGTNEYLYENLNRTTTWSGTEGKQPTNNISGIYGYWTLSSKVGDSANVRCVNFAGNVYDSYAFNNLGYGVRAVINLKL